MEENFTIMKRQTQKRNNNVNQDKIFYKIYSTIIIKKNIFLNNLLILKNICRNLKSKLKLLI